MKPKMLFVDDRAGRIKQALVLYSDYDVTIAPNYKEAMRQLCAENWDVVSLDYDLNGGDFNPFGSSDTGLEIIRNIIQNDAWPMLRNKPKKIIIHSTNLFGAQSMYEGLTMAGYENVELKPFNWKQYQHGVVAGAFDVIHPGYVYLLREAKELCHKVTVLLHDKPNQVFDLRTRTEVLLAMKYVDDVIPYSTEEGLTTLLERIKPDVRIVGSDHQEATTRPDLPFKTHYHVRDHDWSATKYKKRIATVMLLNELPAGRCKICGQEKIVNPRGECLDCFFGAKE